MLARRQLFVDKIVLDRAAPGDAYRFAYGREDVSDAEAAKRGLSLAKNSQIQAAIRRGREIVAFKAEATGEMAVQRFWDIATADPRELIGLHIGACRSCWGINYAYQWTIVEYREKLAELDEAERTEPEGHRPMPDISGGFGYNRTVEPNPECPSCNGIGQHYARPVDTRDLSDQAALLFNGVKQKADGSFEILIADRSKALRDFADARGVFITRVQHGGGLTLHHAVTRAVDPHEASQAYQELVKGAIPMLPAPDDDDSA